MALSIDKAALRRYIERSLQDLPPVPSVATKVMEATEDPGVSATTLDSLISSDQAMAAKVLRVVNSAYYGLSAQVGSINHAVVILGTRTIRNLVLSMAAMSLVKARTPAMLRTQVAFWRHSFGTGAAARLIGSAKNLQPTDTDRAFVGALLHDLGKLFLYSSFTDLYTETLEHSRREEVTLEEAERRLLGIDHAEVGGLITQAWKFPPFLCHLITFHHGPFEGPLEPPLAVVHASDYYCRLAGFSMVDSPGSALDAGVKAWLDMDDLCENDLVEEICSRVASAEEVFGLL